MAPTRIPAHDVTLLGDPAASRVALLDPAVDATTSPLAMTLPDLPHSDFHNQACGYRNTSDRMVIVRCIGPNEFFLERVVFPFELLSFQCPPSSDVQIWTHGLGGPELLETIHSSELLIEPVDDLEAASAPLPFEDLNPWARAS